MSLGMGSGLSASYGQHLWTKINPHHSTIRFHSASKQKGHVPSPRSYINDQITRIWPEHVHRGLPPPSVGAETHQVVQQIVSGGNPGEHTLDRTFTFDQVHHLQRKSN